MSPLVMSHYTLVTALGHGLEPTYQALRARCSGLRPCNFKDAALNTYIGQVEGLEEQRINALSATEGLGDFECRNNLLALLTLHQDGFLQAAIEARERYQAHRVAVVLGTSTSGILEAEQAYCCRDPDSGALPASFLARYRYTHDIFSLGHFIRRYLGLHGPATVISTACSSSAKVFATAARFIQCGLCDAAIVGGVDSLCLTTLYGFSALELISPTPCRPYDAERDGISLGEAGALVLLEKTECAARPGAVALLGYGESCDGYHMSHPHPEGIGAISAMREALRQSCLEPQDIDYINLHGTATRANDRIEDQAVTAVFGTGTACSSTKGWTGHTLGAAGATEAVISALCLTRCLVPGTLNTVQLDPEVRSRVLLENQDRPIRSVLSNIFGFGGNNCSLVLGVL